MFDNTYANLPERFYARLAPTPVTAPHLIKLNKDLAANLGLNPEALTMEMLAGNYVPPQAKPIALAYAGHQFGHFVPQLGDGRAILLGEVVAPDGHRYDLQLKGSGPTPYSRQGDGRAALGPVLREYIISEAMAALGVPTTRSLAVVTTGERVLRDTVLPGAILTRVARSHIRVGTFQYFAARGDIDGLRRLTDYAIARHFPEAVEREHPYRAFLAAVVARQAELISKWMLIGFIHGVMNTDNTSIAGETIDYGPCAFMEAYDPKTVFSAIDRHGRYAYGNQPSIAYWNLARLAEALLPLLDADEEKSLDAANECISNFGAHFQRAYHKGLCQKIGLPAALEGDVVLAEDLLTRMVENSADFTLTFRRLCDAAMGEEYDVAIRALFADPRAYDAWAIKWRQRLAEESHLPETRANTMCRVNPIYIPRNHLVEAALSAASLNQDFSLFEELLEVVSQPYEQRPSLEKYAKPARSEEYVHQTFCGT